MTGHGVFIDPKFLKVGFKCVLMCCGFTKCVCNTIANKNLGLFAKKNISADVVEIV